MAQAPFRFAGTTLAGAATGGGLHGAMASLCCAPRAVPAAPVARRARLADLDPNYHCSIIGTCLGTVALRKLVLRCLPGLERAPDVDIHHEAVQLASSGGAGAKTLHKALDEAHAAALKRFAALRDDRALEEAWRLALANGEVPGAYWALMTHAQATLALRKRAFGDVHMLSHLVGAANRADIRRLQALEQHNAELAAQVERQQSRLQSLAQERQALAEQAAAQALALAQRVQPAPAADTSALLAELTAREQALAHQTSRREAAQQQMLAERQAREALQQRIGTTLDLVEALQAELQALEQQLAARLEPAAPSAGTLHGQRVVYVGGRPGSNRSIRAMVQAAGGELVLHDGGIEDRKGLLAATLPGADCVVFPVDCIDHDSMATVKRLCERHQIPFHPVRSASAASFAALLAQLAHAPRPALAPRQCLRQG
ncbi:DUF2325 domain-containing protein [Pseudorhodoferax sp.]|uniref:DUF2325 domain-containing protein n=1 Tax=Pseudorhodoferax sp. TaxID=1993553 RepID=UPI002DD6B390|nr:DUF2325 domain-containing protein [Pseudorhodoferax sp.]